MWRVWANEGPGKQHKALQGFPQKTFRPADSLDIEICTKSDFVFELS